MVDARLRHGSRVDVAVRLIAVDGPLVSISKFAERALDMGRLIEIGTLRPAMAEVLAAAVAGKVSTIIAGGTGSGKTTMLNALSNFIPTRDASSPSRMRRNCSSSSLTSAVWRPAPPTSRAGAKSDNATLFATR